MTQISSLTLADLLSATAAKQPTPGGGAIAGICGALAAALAEMALHYTAGKKAFIAHDAEIRAAITQFQRTRENLLELADEDIAAYQALSLLLKLPETDRRAHPDYAATVTIAIRVPQTALGFALHTLELCTTLLEKTNPFLISDLGIAAAYAHATVHASELNIRVNLPLIPDPAEAAELRDSTTQLSTKADTLYTQFRTQLLNKI